MSVKRYYIGLACTYHDPAIAILDRDGTILFAEATERSLQSKRAPGMPCDEINYTKYLIKKFCHDADEVVLSYSWSKAFYNRLLFQDAFHILEFKKRLLDLLLKDMASNVLVSGDVVSMYQLQLSCIHQAGTSFITSFQSLLPNCLIKKEYHPHHLTHAAYACYTSPYEAGTCVVMDGYGEKGSYSIFNYRDNNVHLVSSLGNWGSLGFYYTLLTKLCGFDPIKGEAWKVMGLAPFGQLNSYYYELLKSMIKVKGCSFRFTLFKQWLHSLRTLSAIATSSNFPFKEVINLAYAGQFVFTEVMVELLHNIFKTYPSENLIYTGGCALNSSFNGQILKKTNYKHLYIPPAPGDDGNALGAALLSYYHENPYPVSLHKNHSPYLGSELSENSLNNFLQYSGMKKVYFLPETICEKTASLLAEGKLIGWVQGRAEFGPRALGNRSILADPRSPAMKDKINSCIKFREEFRPFAPSVLHEYGPEYFENYEESPYMERTLKFNKGVQTKVPAVVHIDGTGRLQSVREEWNPRFYHLIHSFYKITGIPLVLNTSFNVMGKPIIHSVEDALSVFLTSGLDAVVIGDYLIEK